MVANATNVKCSTYALPRKEGAGRPAGLRPVPGSLGGAGGGRRAAPAPTPLLVQVLENRLLQGAARQR